MPLPKSDTPWPPVNSQPLYAKMAEWAAWYSGEPSRIIDVYASSVDASGGTIPWYRFWRRAAAQRDGSQRALLHVPVASDIASVRMRRPIVSQAPADGDANGTGDRMAMSSIRNDGGFASRITPDATARRYSPS